MRTSWFRHACKRHHHGDEWTTSFDSRHVYATRSHSDSSEGQTDMNGSHHPTFSWTYSRTSNVINQYDCRQASTDQTKTRVLHSSSAIKNLQKRKQWVHKTFPATPWIPWETQTYQTPDFVKNRSFSELEKPKRGRSRVSSVKWRGKSARAESAMETWLEILSSLPTSPDSTRTEVRKSIIIVNQCS